MRITRVGRRVLFVVVVSVVLAPPAPASAAELVVARAESLNEVFDGMEAVSGAIGREFNREMVLDMGSGMLGSDLAGFLALDRPVAALMPVEGMMLRQNGVVAAIPVTDAAAAIAALASRFPAHTAEGGLHAFSIGQESALYVTAADGYLRIGGTADLVARFDPLAGGSMGSTLAVELTLETIAPMIEAGLAIAEAETLEGLQESASKNEEITFDPAAMGAMVEASIDAVRWLVANTSSLRLRLDVDDGHVRLAEDLIARKESDLAAFIAAQQGGLPEIAKLADPESAWYMAGQVTLSNEHRQGLKTFVDAYLDLMTSMPVTRPGSPEANGGDTGPGDEAEDPLEFWKSYIATMGPYAQRWIDCVRGDMVASFHARPGQPFRFTEAVGLVQSDACADLVAEMSDELVNAVEGHEGLGDVVTVARGPEIGGVESLLMSFDMVGMLEEMGQETDEQAAAMVASVYGETLTASMVTAGDVVLVAGGTDAPDQLGALAAALKGPAKVPTFAPLEVRPGLMMGMNLGPMLTWMKASAPKGADALEGAAERLSGEVGRVPMALTFGSQMATFEIAVSLETIEVMADIAAESRAIDVEAEAAAPEG